MQSRRFLVDINIVSHLKAKILVSVYNSSYLSILDFDFSMG